MWTSLIQGPPLLPVQTVLCARIWHTLAHHLNQCTSSTLHLSSWLFSIPAPVFCGSRFWYSHQSNWWIVHQYSSIDVHMLIYIYLSISNHFEEMLPDITSGMVKKCDRPSPSTLQTDVSIQLFVSLPGVYYISICSFYNNIIKYQEKVCSFSKWFSHNYANM